MKPSTIEKYEEAIGGRKETLRLLYPAATQVREEAHWQELFTKLDQANRQLDLEGKSNEVRTRLDAIFGSIERFEKKVRDLMRDRNKGDEAIEELPVGTMKHEVVTKIKDASQLILSAFETIVEAIPVMQNIPEVKELDALGKKVNDAARNITQLKGF